jgi:hypothetical protein
MEENLKRHIVLKMDYINLKLICTSKGIFYFYTSIHNLDVSIHLLKKKVEGPLKISMYQIYRQIYRINLREIQLARLG